MATSMGPVLTAKEIVNRRFLAGAQLALATARRRSRSRLGAFAMSMRQVSGTLSMLVTVAVAVYGNCAARRMQLPIW